MNRFLCVAWLVAGCGVGPEQESPAGAALGQADASVQNSATPDGGAPVCPANTCPADGEFFLVVHGSQIADLEGAPVQVVAVEPGDNPADLTQRRTASLRSQVQSGQFMASCPKALKNNLNYPTLGVWLDANRNGTCDGADLVAVDQRYAWLRGEVFEVTTGVDAVLAWTTVADSPLIWDETSVCRYFGFAAP